jgi:beta-barrel assembly-enhancing protease
MFDARFFDGKTAVERAVRVRAEADALAIEGDRVSASWPRRSIEVHRQRGLYRLTSKQDPDARLVLAHTPEIEAELTRLGLAGARHAARRALLLGVPLVAAGAMLAAIIFVLMPMSAEPLAARTPLHVEDQFGENLQRQVQVVLRPCRDTGAADAAIAPLTATLAEAAGAPFDITLTFVRTDIPNALALPGGRVLVTSGLLDTLEQPDELAAVLAHEIGHVRARDSMVSLYRHMGLGLLLEAVTGGSGIAQQIVLLGGQLAELRFTREQEMRADVVALETMARAGYDPEALARAFEAIVGRAEEMKDLDLGVEAPEWLLSHPNIEARIARARAAAQPARAETLSPEAWGAVRAACARDAK